VESEAPASVAIPNQSPTARVARSLREWIKEGQWAAIDKRNADLGRDAVRMLMDRVEGKLPAEPQVWRVEPRLVEVVAAEVG